MNTNIDYPSSGHRDSSLPLMSRFCRKFKRWWFKTKFSNSQIDALLYGRFRVKYKDGHKSIKMYYRTAKDYASLFGGEVIDAF